jgi:TonB family protein
VKAAAIALLLQASIGVFSLQAPSEPIPVDEKAQRARLVSGERPVYPPLAAMARIEGIVSFRVVVARDGSVKTWQVLSGHPLLVQSAIDSVKTYRYQPTLIDGQAMEVETTVRVRFFLAGDEKTALDELRQKARKSPKDADAQARLAHFLREMGELQEAEQSYRQAVSLKPENQWFRFGLADVLSDQGRHAEAIATARHGVQLRPKNPEGHARLSSVLERAGDLDAAVEEYREVVRLTPKDPSRRYNLGMLLRRRGDLDGAISEFHECLRRWKGDAQVHFQLGMTLEQKGQFTEALEHYQKATKASPGDERIRAAYERLSND